MQHLPLLLAKVTPNRVLLYMEETQAVPVVTKDSTPEEGINNVVKLTKEQLKQAIEGQRRINKQIKHDKMLDKKRQERWSQPFSDAKIEDVQSVLQYSQNVQLELALMYRALEKKGLITKQELENERTIQNERLAAFKRLTTDPSINEEEKRAEAKKWDIPLNLLGLNEEQTPTTDGATDIQEVTG
jgi:hypothetical protein